MIWFKACPRCHGTLLRDQDKFGTYISCLQCGYYLSPEEQAALYQEHQARRHRTLAAATAVPARQGAEVEPA